LANSNAKLSKVPLIIERINASLLIDEGKILKTMIADMLIKGGSNENK
jgi:hypothetical protein